MDGLAGGRTEGRTDGRTRDITMVSFPKCSQLKTGNTKLVISELVLFDVTAQVYIVCKLINTALVRKLTAENFLDLNSA